MQSLYLAKLRSSPGLLYPSSTFIHSYSSFFTLLSYLNPGMIKFKSNKKDSRLFYSWLSFFYLLCSFGIYMDTFLSNRSILRLVIKSRLITPTSKIIKDSKIVHKKIIPFMTILLVSKTT
jgi:hypothetical protein